MLNNQRAAAPWGDYDCLVIQFLGFEHRQSQAYRLFTVKIVLLHGILLHKS